MAPSRRIHTIPAPGQGAVGVVRREITSSSRPGNAVANVLVDSAGRCSRSVMVDRRTSIRDTTSPSAGILCLAGVAGDRRLFVALHRICCSSRRIRSALRSATIVGPVPFGRTRSMTPRAGLRHGDFGSHALQRRSRMATRVSTMAAWKRSCSTRPRPLDSTGGQGLRRARSPIAVRTSMLGRTIAVSIRARWLGGCRRSEPRVAQRGSALRRAASVGCRHRSDLSSRRIRRDVSRSTAARVIVIDGSNHDVLIGGSSRRQSHRRQARPLGACSKANGHRGLPRGSKASESRSRSEESRSDS